jgi:hypothetical protein
LRRGEVTEALTAAASSSSGGRRGEVACGLRSKDEESGRGEKDRGEGTGEEGDDDIAEPGVGDAGGDRDDCDRDFTV